MVSEEEEVAIAQAQAVINENCNDEILKMDTSDGGNADAFAVEHSDDFIYVREIGWLRYNGSYWQHDDGAVMLAMRKSIEDRHIRLWNCGDSKANELKRNTYKINAAIEQAQAIKTLIQSMWLMVCYTLTLVNLMHTTEINYTPTL